ncbi:MAG: GPW/gp25 family protein [Desulfovibrionaceae bacterium]
MSATTGQALSGSGHLRQSVADVLSTRIGTRVMRRDYGSRLPSLVDLPMNDATLVEVYMATAEALDIWESRFRLRRVRVAEASAGRLVLELEGDSLDDDGKPVTMEGIVIV